jgi:hypothetical protein
MMVSAALVKKFCRASALRTLEQRRKKTVYLYDLIDLLVVPLVCVGGRLSATH